MDENASKIKKKILFGTIGCLIGSAVVLCATAAIVNLVTGAGYAASFRYPATYLVWVCLIAVGVAAVAIDIRVRGSRRVLKVNVDLENSHFMTRKEIRHNGGYTFTRLSQLNEVKDGVPIIAEKHKNDIDIVLREPIHTLYIGATGTGKTVGCVSPTIEILSRTKTKPSMLITDPKGELYIRHAATLEKAGYNVTVIDLSDVYHSTQWNPFNDIWRKTDEMSQTVEQRQGKYHYGGKVYLTEQEAQQARRERNVRLNDEIYVDMQDLIYTMCPIENKQDMTWQRGARDLLFALSLAFWEDVRDGYMERDKFNLYNLYRNVTDYAKGECDELKAYFATREPISKTRGLSNTVLVSEDRTLSSYLGDVNQYLTWMADGGIAALTSGNSVEFMEFDEAPNVLFLKIPDEKENRYKLVSLLITQMYKALVEKATRNQELGKTDTQKLLRNVYFIMDEFGNLPKLYKMDSVVTVGRSRGIFMLPVIQDFNQLDDKYGREVAATIRSNCNIQVFIGSNDENTRRLFSEACGKKKVKQISYNENNDMSVSTSAQSVPLIYPNELEHLNDPPNGIIGNSIITCLGNYPIRGKTTPIFQAVDIYGLENTKEKKGEFIFFDELAHHYDIQRMTLYIEQEKALFEGKPDDPVTPPDGGSGGVQPGEDPLRQSNDYAARERKKAEEMLDQILDRISKLKNKIPSDQYDLLIRLDIKHQIYLLDELAEKAAAQGNYLLSVEIENTKSFLIHRCFIGDEIRAVEAECRAVRSA